LNAQKPIRRWLAWTIVGVWIATVLALLVATHTYPATTARVSLSVREISFRTNASHILGPSDEEQLLVSGVGSVQIQLNSLQKVTTDESSFPATSIQVEGQPSGSCTFYRIRSSGLDLDGPSILTFGVPSTVKTRSFNLKVHGPLSGHLTSRPGEAVLKPGFECTRVRVNGGPVGRVAVSFSPQGGDSIFFSTSPDPQISFDLAAESQIGDTQIPIIAEVRFSHINPHTQEEKTVLLPNKNEISFEEVGKNVPLDESDLLVVAPKHEFYLSQFTVQDGVHLTLHGVARNVRKGPGASDLPTVMPSSLDHLDNVKRIFGIAPSIVGFILGILERMGLLAEK
jgi:hypothetical protein